MKYRPLGRTGVQVSSLCLGTMPFGQVNNDRADCERIIHKALDAGVNFIDTADIYSKGESERIVGTALSGGRRDSVIVTSKFNRQMGPDLNERGNSRRWIMTAVEGSLSRLNTDRIDLYIAHAPEPGTDIDETLGAMSDLVTQGKVRYIGTSVFPASQLVEAEHVALQRGHRRFVCEQPSYSMLARGVEFDVLPTCERLGLGVMAWSPLSAGWLSGRWRLDQEAPPSTQSGRQPGRFDLSIPENRRKFEAADALGRLAEETGMSLVHMALAFVLNHPAITAAVISGRTGVHLDQQLGAVDIQLEDDVLDIIDQIVQPGTYLNALDAGLNPDLDPARRRR